MNSGRLGKASLAAGVDTDVCTVTAGTVATVNVNFCNTTAADIAVRLAVRDGALAASDYVEYDAVIPANGVLERSALVLSAGETIVARAAAVGVSVRVFGFEEVL